MSTEAEAKRLLRRRLRAWRRRLTRQQQVAAARRLARHRQVLKRLRHVAAYLPSDGEIDPQPLLRALPARLYLPCLTPTGLLFRRHGRRLIRHHLGLWQPPRGLPRRLWTLDAICLPLVAFDHHGRRLGRGGGHYDRALADLARRPRRPLLIGLAHAGQYVDALPQEPWDQGLDHLFSDLQRWSFRRHEGWRR